MAHKYVNPLDAPYKAPESTPSTDGVAVPVADPSKVPANTNTPTPTPTPSPDAPATLSTSTSTIPTDSDIQALGELINSLGDAELAKLRIIAKQVAPDIAEAAGIDSNIRKLANGSVQVTIVLSPDIVEPLIAWAESAELTLGEQIQQIAETAISSYINMDWRMMMTPPVAPVTPVTPPITVVTTVPPAVGK
jgi:hypothetical protein